MSTRASNLLAITFMITVLAAACGGVGLSEQQSDLVATANANTPSLQLTSDLSSTQMLDGRTGQITDLSQVVTGDRPVLMWYWAPN
jgi:hypothetical protein